MRLTIKASLPCQHCCLSLLTSVQTPAELKGNGSHIAKIEGTLNYLEAMDGSTDNDLVMMMDAYGTLPSSCAVESFIAVFLTEHRYLVSAERRSADRSVSQNQRGGSGTASLTTWKRSLCGGPPADDRFWSWQKVYAKSTSHRRVLSDSRFSSPRRSLRSLHRYSSGPQHMVKLQTTVSECRVFMSSPRSKLADF